MKLGGPNTQTMALLGTTLVPAVMLVGSTLSIWMGEADATNSLAFELGRVSQVVLCLTAAAFYFSGFDAMRRLMRGRIAPQRALRLRAKQLGKRLLGLWLLCSAPSLLLRPSSESVFEQSLLLAVVIAATGALSMLAQKLRGPISRYWRGLRWPLLEGRPPQAFAQLGLLPALLTLTGSPEHAHAGLPYWGETLDWRYLLRLLMLSYMALVLLQFRDLHWRRLLAPGGTGRASIGWRIYVSSLKGNLLIATLLTGLGCALVAVISVYTGKFSLLAAVQWPAFAAALASDLALATALAVVLRGFAGSKEAALLWEVSLLTLTVGVTAAWSFWDFGPEPTFTWQRDSTHALALLAALLLLCQLIRRAWHRADLVQLLNKAQAPAAEQD